jgi:hypothetical protein
MSIIFFSHAGESHEDVVSGTQHLIELSTWVAVPIILAVMAFVPWLISKLSKSKSLPVIVSLIELLLVGMLTYSVMPALSIISIIVGFVLAFVIAFGGIAR